MGNPINFRFRPGKDDDIEAALEQQAKLNRVDKSDVIRSALRMYLFQEQPTEHKQHRQITVQNTDDIILEHVEKPDNDIAAGLDDLLGNF